MKIKNLISVSTLILITMIPSQLQAKEKLLPAWDGWWGNEDEAYSRLNRPSDDGRARMLGTRLSLHEEFLGEKTWIAGMVFQLGDTHKIRSGYELTLYHRGQYHKSRTFEVHASTFSWDVEYGGSKSELEANGVFQYYPDKDAYKVNVDNKKTFMVHYEEIYSWMKNDAFVISSPELDKFIRDNHNKRISIFISASSGGSSFLSTSNANPEDLRPGLELTEPNSQDKKYFARMIQESDKIRIVEEQ